MADLTFKCSSCGGYLTFDPESQAWKCPYCGSSFAEDVLRARDEDCQARTDADASSETADGAQVVYHCPSCGSEIITDETTVATQCYYCHSPVVLQGKLKDDMRPELVLPFEYSKDAAVEQFMAWVKKKRYVPSAFFSKEQVESISGVYYPHFVSDITVKGELTGTGKNTEIHETARYIDTYTHYFHVERAGLLKFSNIMRPALKSANRKLSDGIHPFPLKNLKKFSGAYLSGFLAERRDMDEESIRQDVYDEVAGRYVKPLLLQDVHYQSTDAETSARMTDFQSSYVLLPTWILTYPNPMKPEEPYYYAMNGCTGKICGKLPVSRGKLLGHCAIISGAVLALALLLFYFVL